MAVPVVEALPVVEAVAATAAAPPTAFGAVASLPVVVSGARAVASLPVVDSGARALVTAPPVWVAMPTATPVTDTRMTSATAVFTIGLAFECLKRMDTSSRWVESECPAQQYQRTPDCGPHGDVPPARGVSLPTGPSGPGPLRP